MKCIKICRLLFLFIYLTLIQTGWAESSLPFKNVNDETGSFYNIVNDFLKGDEGHIWFGSQYGLHRFDGYKTKHYLNDSDDRNTLVNNVVQSLAKDSKGNIWIATFGGLASYNPKSDTFTSFTHQQGQLSGLSSNKLAVVFVDSKDRIWIGHWNQGLSLYDPDKKKFTHFLHQRQFDRSLSNNSVRSISEDDEGYIWVGTSSKNREFSGLHRLNPVSNIIERYDDIVKEKLSFFGIKTIFFSSDNHMYIGTKIGGLIDVDRINNTINKISMSDDEQVEISSIESADAGKLWIGTYNHGLFHYNSISKKIKKYIHNDSSYSIKANQVNTIMKDKDQLWISHGVYGLNTLNLISREFHWLNTNGSYGKKIPSKSVFLGVTEDKDGGLWIANMNQGVLHWNPSDRKIDTLTSLGENHDLKKSIVQSVFVDSQNQLWIGTKKSGLFRYDLESKSVHHFSPNNHDGSNIRGISVRSIMEHPVGTILIAIDNVGLDSIDIENNNVITFTSSNEASLKTAYTLNSMFLSRSNTVWLGTQTSGAIEIDDQGNYVIFHRSNNTKGISNDYVTGFAEDSSGAIWLSSDAGLNKIERVNGNVIYTQLKDENLFFKKNAIPSLQIDGEDNIWFSYNNNVSRYSDDTKELIHFNVYSGSNPGIYVDGNSFKDSTGRLYFGGAGGLVSFSPEKIRNLVKQPNIIIDELFINNKVVSPHQSNILKHTISFSDKITFSHQQSHFSFSFSTDQKTDTESMVFRYRMLGYKKQWIETNSDNRRATFTNLDDGDYEFQAQASSNGLWNSKVRSINITILPPPWQSWWAYTIYFLLLICIVGNFIWQRYKIFNEIKLKSEAINQRNKQLKLTATLFQNTSEGVWLLDKEYKYLSVNSGFKDITGLSEDDVLGTTIEIFDRDNKNDNFAKVLLDRVKKSSRWQGEIWNTRKNGELYPMEIVIDKIITQNDVSEAVEEQYVGIFSDITERRRAEEDLRKMAFFDTLTKLPNKTQFQALVQSSINHCLSTDDQEFFILFIDLDNFKNINDSLGHSPGDEVLVYIANKLNKHVETPMVTARLGGDEFAILVPPQAIHFNTVEFATGYLEKILILLRDNFVAESFEFNITASIGVSLYPNDGDNYEDLVRSADTAMYEAKSKGRDQGKFYSQDMNQRAVQRLAYENELGRAIEAEEIKPFFQAKENLQTGEVQGLEVLARWNSPKFGHVSPEVFISLAEETRHIDQLSDQLLRQACKTILPLIQAKRFTGRMAFNLSAIQFNDQGLLSKIDSILEECCFPTNFLELEVTESLMMSDPERAISTLRQFRERGINIALDDFGTGYSSLSYLKELPLDVLKIDRSFIIDIANNPRDKNMVASIIKLSHDLNLKVVAEGVEDEDQKSLLQDMGCDILQGYILSRPLKGTDYTDFLIQSTSLAAKISDE